MIRLIMKKKLQTRSGGQVVLMVLLASALVLTLGLSAARQATVETSIDTDQELLKNAFNAAESGIEYYLKTGDKNYANTDSPDGGATLETSPLLGDKEILSFNHKLNPENPEFFWLVDHTQNGSIGTNYYNRPSGGGNTIDICSDQPGPVRLKVDYFYGVGTSIAVQRGDGTNPILSTSGITSCIDDFSLIGNSILLVVTPLEEAMKVSITGDVVFEPQGEKITSTGIVGKINNQITIEHPYKLFIPFLIDPVVSEDVVTN